MFAMISSPEKTGAYPLGEKMLHLNKTRVHYQPTHLIPSPLPTPKVLVTAFRSSLADYVFFLVTIYFAHNPEKMVGCNSCSVTKILL